MPLESAPGAENGRLPDVYRERAEPHAGCEGTFRRALRGILGSSGAGRGRSGLFASRGRLKGAEARPAAWESADLGTDLGRFDLCFAGIQDALPMVSRVVLYRGFLAILVPRHADSLVSPAVLARCDADPILFHARAVDGSDHCLPRFTAPSTPQREIRGPRLRTVHPSPRNDGPS